MSIGQPETLSLLSDIEFKSITANGISLRLAMQGNGPLVVPCHGWPESCYSWRHQIPALAETGYTAVAYDVRGMNHQRTNWEGGFIGTKPPDAQLLDGMTRLGSFPDWFSQDGSDYLTSYRSLS